MLYKIYNVRGPFLIVAPLSTIPHWEREFRAWTDFNVIVYHGSAKSRNLIIETEYYYRDFDGSRLSDLHKFQVLITTYEMIRVGVDHLRPLLWTVGVFDEAHKLKNKNSKALETLRGFGIEHKILLTGTPLQNSVSELFSLLNFLHPLRFANEQLFLHDFGDLRTSDKVQQLQALLKPLMLRRFKEDVEKSIPVKEETVIEVELTKVQKGWYRAILERNFAWIKTGNKGGKGPSLLNIMMELRKCCNHPFLITGVEDRIFCDKFLELYPDKRGSSMISGFFGFLKSVSKSALSAHFSQK
jgi:SNF2 family DNA or RNA helicase